MSTNTNLILNGDFETGNFTHWTLGGYLNGPGDGIFISPTAYNIPVYDGTYAAGFGSFYTDGTLSQTFVTTPGQHYTLNFELENSNFHSAPANDFAIKWDGNTIYALVNANSFGYTLYTFDVVGDSSGYSTLEFDGYNNPDAFALDDVSVTPLCFMSGTMISTPFGEIAVETVKRGDLVLTTKGQVAPVSWVGRQTVSRRFADPLRVLPIRIKAGALADNVPSRDLLLSPDHAVLVEGALIQAGALVNGTSIVREKDVPETFTYYHVELDDHSLILAENTPAETFVDNVDRMDFDNWARTPGALSAG